MNTIPLPDTFPSRNAPHLAGLAAILIHSLAIGFVTLPGIVEAQFTVSTRALTPDVALFDELVMSPTGLIGYNGYGWETEATQSGVVLDGSLIVSNGPAPGTDGNFFSVLDSPFINAAGQIAFDAVAKVGPTKNEYKRGFWAGLPGALQLVAFHGGDAPGTNGGTFHLPSNAPEAPTISSYNALGQVAFKAGIAEAGNGEFYGIWAGTPGALQLVARDGHQAPGLAPGRTLSGVSHEILLNELGQIAFIANVTDPNPSERTVPVVYHGPIASPEALDLHGLHPPGTEPEVRFGGVDKVALSATGAIAIRVPLTVPESGLPSNLAGNAFFAGPPDALELVAREKHPAPGAIDGATFTSLRPPLINAHGEVAFKATLSSGSHEAGIWVGRPGHLRLIARSGESAPGTDAQFNEFDNLVLSDTGQVFFTADLTGESVQLGTDDQVLYATDKTGVLRLLARTGSSLNGSPNLEAILTRPIGSESYAATGDGRRCGMDAEGRILFVGEWFPSRFGMFVATPVESAPVIPVEGQPKSVTGVIGGGAVFRVNALGSRPASFQWRRGGQDLPGETNDTLTIENLSSGDAEGYSVVVTNAYGSLESQVAQLTFPPFITQQPRSQVLANGDSFSAEVEVSSPLPVGYQWQFKGPSDVSFSDVDGASNAEFQIASVDASDAGRYLVRVSNADGSVTSEELVLTVAPAGKALVRRVAMTGDRVPEFGGVSFDVFSGGSLNDDGDVAMHTASLSDSEGQSVVIDGTWVGRDDDFVHYGWSGAFGQNLSNSRDVAAESNVIGGFNPGLLYGDPAGFRTLAERFQPASGTSQTFTYAGRPVINSTGLAAFSYGLSGGTTGLFSGTPEDLQLLALTNDQAPGLGTGVLFEYLANEVTINDAGTVVFWARVTGPAISDTNDEGIWTATSGGIQRIVAEGAQAPGLPAGVTIGSIEKQYASINAAGEILFHCSLNGVGVNGSNNEAIFAGPPDALRLVVRKGQSAGGRSIDQLSFITDRVPVLGGSGHVVFAASSGGKEGLWLWTPGSMGGALTLLALQDSPAPGRPAGEVFGHPSSQPDFRASVNSSGLVLFKSEITHPGATTAKRGIWLTHAGAATCVVATGDPFDVGGGIIKTVDFFHFEHSSGGQDGKPRNLNEAGEALLFLNFTDGASGLFLASSRGAVLDPPTNFTIASAPPAAVWQFDVTLAADAAGLFLRVQSTETPDVEGSWTDLPNGGQMNRSGNLWTLTASEIPAGTRFFRVVAAASGFTDGIVQYPTSFQVEPFVPQPRPDIAVGSSPSSLKGRGSYAAPPLQKVSLTSKKAAPVTAYVLVANDGNFAEKLIVSGAGETTVFGVDYFQGAANVTAGVVAGNHQTATLSGGGGSTRFTVKTSPVKAKVRVTRKVGKMRRFIYLKKTFLNTLRAKSSTTPAISDAGLIEVTTQ